MTLAPEKTRRRDLASFPAPNILLDDRNCLCKNFKIFGVRHVQQGSKAAKWKLGCIRCIGHLLDGLGVAATLQAASPQSYGAESACVVCMSAFISST